MFDVNRFVLLSPDSITSYFKGVIEKKQGLALGDGAQEFFWELESWDHRFFSVSFVFPSKEGEKCMFQIETQKKNIQLARELAWNFYYLFANPKA